MTAAQPPACRCNSHSAVRTNKPLALLAQTVEYYWLWLSTAVGLRSASWAGLVSAVEYRSVGFFRLTWSVSQCSKFILSFVTVQQTWACVLSLLRNRLERASFHYCATDLSVRPFITVQQTWACVLLITMLIIITGNSRSALPLAHSFILSGLTSIPRQWAL